MFLPIFGVMRAREWFWLENLLSLSRVFLAPLAWYFLSKPGLDMLGAAVATLTLAGITDGLDGMVARRSKHAGTLGPLLDPVADKIFAAVMVVALVTTRDFPLWAAAVVIGRDLLILGASLVLLRGAKTPLHSNLSGKYAFFAIIMLLGSYVLDFPVGENLMMVVAMTLIAASLVNYGRVFLHLRKGETLPPFADTPTWQLARKLAIVGIAVIYFVAFIRYWPEWRRQWETDSSLHSAASVDTQALYYPVTVDQIHFLE